MHSFYGICFNLLHCFSEKYCLLGGNLLQLNRISSFGGSDDIRNLPLYCLASVYLVLQILASLFFMGLQGSCEPWCYAINVSLLAVYLCALLATRATLSHIVQVDKSAEQQTSFVNALMLELETMRDRTEGERKKKIEEVIDVARYSNLRSCDASQEIEEVILETAKNLSAVIQDEPNSSITDMTNRISEQLKRRDRICKK